MESSNFRPSKRERKRKRKKKNGKRRTWGTGCRRSTRSFAASLQFSIKGGEREEGKRGRNAPTSHTPGNGHAGLKLYYEKRKKKKREEHQNGSVVPHAAFHCEPGDRKKMKKK